MTTLPPLDPKSAELATLGSREALPGPKSAALIARQVERESGAVSYPRRLPIAIRRAAGCYVEDLDGHVFIDFLSGAGVLSLGHNHPELVAAVKQQLNLLAHGLDFPTDVKDRFTTAHLSMLPESMRAGTKMHFCGPTGSDAVEAAIKLSKLYTGGSEVIAFTGSYHGCSAGSLAVSSVRSMKEGLANLMPGAHFFPYGSTSDRSAREHALAPAECAAYLHKALVDSHSGLAKVAAVILELVQGEGGVVAADRAFVQAVRQVTAQLDIPLIADEIQTGCGRTGTWFAFEQYEIEPDIVLASKALSGIGAPVSAIFYRRKLDVWDPGMHIGTFRGNQLAFAAGAAMVEVVKRDQVLDNVRERAAQATAAFERIAAEYPVLGPIRGKGLMIGAALRDPDTGEFLPDLTREVQRLSLQHGLILEVGGRDDGIIRMLPPLNVNSTTMARALDVFRTVVAIAQRRWDGRVVPLHDPRDGGQLKRRAS
jgi:diaminobutyrate-2-oxoglutarate transaminase